MRKVPQSQLLIDLGLIGIILTMHRKYAIFLGIIENS
jgi:hypothetical protein